MLSLGLGATVVMADMLDRLLLRPPTGIGSPDRVARIYTQTEGGHASALITNYTTVERLREGLTPEVEAIAPYMAERVGLGRGRDARALSIVACGDAYFDVLGLTARL